MKILKQLIYLVLLLPMALTAQQTKGVLMGISEITVKQGQNAQFMEGVKLYKECYKKNNGTDPWNVWHRVQGAGNVYVVTGTMANWAEMDKKDAAGDACRETMNNFIMPFVESVSYNIAQNIPELSMAAVDNTTLIWVTSFEVKNSVDFNEAIKGIAAALKSTEGNERYYWYRVTGGEADAPDYFVTKPLKGFADLDKDEDAVWKVYEKVNGKKATDAMRVKFRNAVDKMWSYMYTFNEDLSFK